jgi:hypothetical protein
MSRSSRMPMRSFSVNGLFTVRRFLLRTPDAALFIFAVLALCSLCVRYFARRTRANVLPLPAVGIALNGLEDTRGRRCGAFAGTVPAGLSPKSAASRDCFRRSWVLENRRTPTVMCTAYTRIRLWSIGVSANVSESHRLPGRPGSSSSLLAPDGNCRQQRSRQEVKGLRPVP